MKKTHYLRPLTPLLSEDILTMMPLCDRIAATRADEALILPAPDGWMPPSKLPLSLILAALVAASVAVFWIC